jgi:hypothetical protein
MVAMRRVEGAPALIGGRMSVRATAARIGLLLLLCSCVLTAMAVAAQTSSAASITVNVRAADTQSPLSGIRVDLYQAMPWGWGGDWRYGFSDALSGSVRFDDLAAGTYTLGLRDATQAYASCYWSDAFTRVEATHIVLDVDAVFTADVELAPAGHIAGVVTDADGAPLEGIYLHAGHIRDMDGQASTGVTAADGSYDLGGLLPADDWVLYLEDVENEDYIYQFWDGARVYEDATQVAVTSGRTTTVDVRMQKSATISGVVTTRLGLPCYRVAVQAFARTESGGWVDVSGVCCDAEGRFTIRQLPPGRYSLAFWSTERFGENRRYYPDTALRSQAKIFTLGYGQAIDLREVVWDDVRKPTPEAPEAETVARGGTAKVLLRVKDPRPGGPTADVTIKVRTRGGKLVQTVVLPRRTVNRWHSGRFVCRLPRGAYRFSVYAVDLGGNRQTRPAVNSLRVR